MLFYEEIKTCDLPALINIRIKCVDFDNCVQTQTQLTPPNYLITALGFHSKTINSVMRLR